MASLPGPANEDSPTQKIIETLHQLSYQSWCSCRLIGQTIFTLNSRSELIFFPCSLSVFIVIARFALAGLSIRFAFGNEMMIQLFNTVFGKVTKLTYFCQRGQLLNSTFADLICVLALLYRRKEVPLFHRSLTEFIVDINRGDAEMGKITVAQLQETRKLVRRHQSLIIVAYGFQVVTGSMLALMFGMNPPPNVDANLWSEQLQTVPPLTLILSSVVILRLIGRFSLVSMFRVLETCAQVIETRLIKETGAASCNYSVPLFRCLERYEKLETLVAELNGTFGAYLAMDLLSLIVANTILLFHLGTHLGSGAWAAVLNSLVILTIHLDITWAICSAAYRMEKSAGKVIQLVKEIAGAAVMSNDDYTKVRI